MSDYRAIAAVTATLQNLLTEAVREAAPGASVILGPPREYPSHEVAEGRINIFLYKVAPNTTWRNQDLPYRLGDGTLVKKPRLAVDLHYILSFYGDDNKHIPNLLLGLAMSTLYASPYPHASHVPKSDGTQPEDHPDSTEPNGVDLAGSGLLAQLPALSFVWLTPKEEDVPQIWSTLFQTPYVTSVAYLARVVLIEPSLVPQPALPVRQPQVHVASAQPVLTSIAPQFLTSYPGAELELHGRHLDAEQVRVRIGEIDVEPFSRSSGTLGVLVPPEAQAGTNLVRVVHGTVLPPAGEVHWAIVSNPVAFVLQPRLLGLEVVTPPAVDGEPATTEDGRRTVIVRSRFAPAVTAATEVLLLLNESPPPKDRPLHAYSFQGTVDPEEPDVLELEIDVAPGRYLVRIQIRGVASPLTVDEDPASPTFQHYLEPSLVVDSPTTGRRAKQSEL